MQLLDLLGQSLFEELHDEYRPVFDAIVALEKEFPLVAENQMKFHDPDNRSMSNAQAHLLYTMQGAVPEESRKTRREIREALAVLASIPGIRTVLITLLIESFSATVYMIEHLFFLNREIGRKIEKGELKEFTVEQGVYPKVMIDDLIALTYKIWKAHNVLQNAGQK